MIKILLLLILCPVLVIETNGQATITIDPYANNAIKGHLQLDRQKYFTFSSPSGTQFERNIPEASIRKLMLEEYDIQFGRDLGMVSTATRWSNAVFEDPARSGYMDVAR